MHHVRGVFLCEAMEGFLFGGRVAVATTPAIFFVGNASQTGVGRARTVRLGVGADYRRGTRLRMLLPMRAPGREGPG